jgi:glutathione S-transferase
VDRRARQQDSPAFRRLNPMGLIPALETPEGPLFETGAILLWIADRHGAGLAPASQDPDRGRFLAWLFWMSNTLHPALRILFYPGTHVAGDPGPLLTHTRGRVAAMLDLLDREAQTLGPWLGADRASLLDCYLCPMLRWIPLYTPEPGWFDLARWPRLQAMAERMDARPEALAAARAEGLGETPFSRPSPATPPEGSPL